MEASLRQSGLDEAMEYCKKRCCVTIVVLHLCAECVVLQVSIGKGSSPKSSDHRRAERICERWFKGKRVVVIQIVCRSSAGLMITEQVRIH